MPPSAPGPPTWCRASPRPTARRWRCSRSSPTSLAAGSIVARRGNASQALDQATMFAGISKWVARVTSADALDDCLRVALTVATSGRPGPVVLSIADDVFGGPGRRVRTRDLEPVHAPRAAVRARPGAGGGRGAGADGGAPSDPGRRRRSGRVGSVRRRAGAGRAARVSGGDDHERAGHPGGAPSAVAGRVRLDGQPDRQPRRSPTPTPSSTSAARPARRRRSTTRRRRRARR